MDFEGFPHINWIRLPPEERPDARSLEGHLGTLVMLEYQFCQAVALYDHTCELIGTLIAAGRPIQERAARANWMNISGYYAVLMVYHFRDALHAVRDAVKRTPSLQAQVSMKAIDDAIEEFGREFPNCKALRDNVGHYVDKIYNPAKRAKHSPTTGPHLHGTIVGRELVFAHEGRQIGQSISESEADKLRRIKRLVFGAFRTERVQSP